MTLARTLKVTLFESRSGLKSAFNDVVTMFLLTMRPLSVLPVKVESIVQNVLPSLGQDTMPSFEKIKLNGCEKSSSDNAV
jgi:hypothetical protein